MNALSGKDTTYILDFVNSSEDIRAAFKTFYETAELDGVTDPNLVYDLRATESDRHSELLLP